MKLSNIAIGIVIGLAAISLVGLTILQVNNLSTSLENNRQLFMQKVDLIAASVGSRVSEDSSFPRNLQNVIKSDPNEPGNIVDLQLREIIDELMVEYNLNLPYEYTIYTHKENEDNQVFAYAMGNKALGGEEFDLQCDTPYERTYGWANLTCSKGFANSDNYHLALFFPDLDFWVFTQSSTTLLYSLIFIVLLLGSISYMVIVIRRQKKLSVIKNDFINNLTHEFKTPISSVLLASGVLKKEYHEIDEEKRINYLNLINQEGKRLERQVDKVLQMAMIDSGNFTLEKKQLDVHEIIERVVENMAILIKANEGELKLNLSAAHHWVTADETHLINIITNLVDNALKYTRVSPLIEISTVDHRDGIQISIKDNGIGIGKEIQKFIFDKFYRAETGNVHNIKGFGLGLSYVKKIIDAHKGRIDLSSKLNSGTEFRILFPIS